MYNGVLAYVQEVHALQICIKIQNTIENTSYFAQQNAAFIVFSTYLREIVHNNTLATHTLQNKGHICLMISLLNTVFNAHPYHIELTTQSS